MSRNGTKGRFQLEPVEDIIIIVIVIIIMI